MNESKKAKTTCGPWRFVAVIMVIAGCGGSQPASPPTETGASAEAGSPAAAEATPTGPSPFTERAAEAGLEFDHFNGMSGQYFLAEITCGGGGLIDFDGDGDLDVFFPQGRMLGPNVTMAEALIQPTKPPAGGLLYRNGLIPGDAASLSFSQVADYGADTARSYGCSLAAGDIDNDGHVDLYLANLGANQLLRNLGNGSFEDVTAASRAGDERSTVAAVFFDFDRDGWLDLFVGNNVEFEYQDPEPCFDLSGKQDWCGPGAFEFQRDRLLRNLGDGTFEDVTESSGLEASPLPTLGAVAADFDNDGWLDLYVANDGQRNRLWMNSGDGTFEDRALLAGCALNSGGEAEASMGVTVGDYDNDGDPDLFLAHLIKETNTLYRNDGQGLFDDATQASGLGAASLAYTAFGTGWLDYDNDGWLDLLVANGAVTSLPEQVAAGEVMPLRQPNQLFRSRAGEGFDEVTDWGGSATRLSEVSRGLVLGDVDNDGDVDALIINNQGPARLRVNQVGQENNWLGLRLQGSEEMPRDLLGSRVIVHLSNGRRLSRQVQVDGSYGSSHDPRLTIGLGEVGQGEAAVAVKAVAVEAVPAKAVAVKAVDVKVEVWWPDGTRETFASVPTLRYTTLRPGEGEKQ